MNKRKEKYKCTVHYCTVLYCTVLYSTVLYCTVQSSLKVSSFVDIPVSEKEKKIISNNGILFTTIASASVQMC